MNYLGVDTWEAVLAMFGEGGQFAGAWGFLEVLREAEFGDEISMFFGIESGFAANTPNFWGYFAILPDEPDQLLFAGMIGTSGVNVLWDALELVQLGANRTGKTRVEVY